MAGLVKSGGSIDVSIKVGDNVKIYVYGMNSDNSVCPSIKGSAMDDMEEHLSKPVQMGEKTTQIDASTTEVSITTNYATAKKVEKCDGDNDHHDDGPHTGSLL